VTEKNFEEQQATLVARLIASRNLLKECLADVTVESGWRGIQWSIGDLLAHLKESYYQDLASKILNEEEPQLLEYPYEAEWKRVVDQTLSRVEEDIKVTSSLTSSQLRRNGQMGGEVLNVLDALELSVAHVEEHVVQLKDEIRPREGLPPV
jgi:hypothetical protein